MSGLGIGLGSFVEGLNDGMDMREKLDKRNRQRKDQSALDDLNKETKLKFDAGVKSGTLDPSQYEQFWLQFALPRRKAQLLQEGRIKEASELDRWGKSSAALEGGKLFASALYKSQVGDYDGAISDAIKAGETKGYINHGLELKSKERIEDQDGNLVGFRLHLNDGGKEVTQDVGIHDLPKMIATYANPVQAFKTQQENATAQKKRKNDMEDYAAKKAIDARYKDNDKAGEAYQKTYDSLMKSDLDFADMTPDQQDKRVRQVLNARQRYSDSRSNNAIGLGGGNATTAPAPKRIVVDQANGQRVNPDQAPEAQPGLGGNYSPDAARRVPVPTQRPTPPSAQQDQDQPQSLPGNTAAPQNQAVVNEAQNMAMEALKQGKDPRTVATQMQKQGLTRDQWPDALQRAYDYEAMTGGGAPQL